MKKILVASLLLALTTTACNRSKSSTDPIKQKYVHKYGMQVDKKDWERRGQQGTIITTRKDGVVVSEDYDHGLLHGEVTYTYPHSSILHRRESYEQGRLISAVDHFRSGVPSQETIYGTEGDRWFNTWYEDGTPKAREHYQNDFLLAAEYYTPLNQLDSKVTDGQGVRLTRYPTGQVQCEETIFAGQVVTKTTYYANGDTESVTPHVDGLVHGTRRTYYEGGQPKAVEEYVRGELHGNVALFENGHKSADISYVHGVKEGLEHHYNAQGHVTEEISWKNDRRHGPARYWVEGEEIVDWYHKDQVVRKSSYDRLNGYPQHYRS